MSETKWTPGPWESGHRECADGQWRTQVYCPEGKAIADLAWYAMPEVDGVIRTSRAYNALLIAAAPELYATLVGLLAIPEVRETAMRSVFGSVVYAADAALAKARGDR